MRDPSLIRLLIPLAIATSLLYTVDAVLVIRRFKAERTRSQDSRPTRAMAVLAILGLIMFTLMNITLAVTMNYRTAQLRRLRQQRAANTVLVALRRQVATELAFAGAAYLPFAVTGVASMLVKSSREKRKRLVESFVPRPVEPQ